jgi:translation initiation factor 1
MEKKGRGGKTVTVVYDLPDNAAFLKDLAQELKRACGTGGAVSENTIELQGDLRDRVRDVLARKGFTVKG